MQNDKNYLLINFLSGGFAGVITDIVCYPLDTIKTRL